MHESGEIDILIHKKMTSSMVEAAFMLNEEARTNFLRQLMQSFRASYICLWLYSYPSNTLGLWGSYYQEEENITSATIARRVLFDAYGRTIFHLDNANSNGNGGTSYVPGLGFRTRVPYLELTDLQLQTSASSLEQQQFYQEARIKKAVFMVCRRGEIELGFANEIQANMEIEMRNWFHEYFPIVGSDLHPLPSSSNNSSSLISSSMDSPDQTLQTATNPRILPILAFAHQQLPREERENVAITEALLRVFTSTSSSSTSHSSVFLHNTRKNPRTSAFMNYSPGNASTSTPFMRGAMSMFKRAISYYDTWNRAGRQQIVAGRPSATQLQHMISERRRRGKLNESFQVLRSLLPPRTKKDKWSVLTSTREYLSSLKAQVAELTRRNQLLEAKNRVISAKELTGEGESSHPTERFSVQLTRVSESTSDIEESTFGLRVRVNGNCPNVELMIRVLEFLRQDRNVNLISMEAMTESTLAQQAIFRLVVEGSEWDQCVFEEAIRRIVADLTQ